MTNEQKTEAPEDVHVWCNEPDGEWVVSFKGQPYPSHAYKLLPETLSQAAVGAAVRSTLESVICYIYDHGNGDVETYEGERAWLISDDLVQSIITLEPEAQQTLNKLLGERDALIAAAKAEGVREVLNKVLGEACWVSLDPEDIDIYEAVLVSDIKALLATDEQKEG